MKEVFVILLKNIGNSLGKILLKTLEVFSQFSCFLNKREDRKSRKEDDKKRKKLEDKIDDVCNNGTLEELFDLKGNR